MGFKDEILRDCEEVDDFLNESFEWKGRIFQTTPDKFTQEETFTDDGNPIRIQLSLRCRVELFANRLWPGGVVPDASDHSSEGDQLHTFPKSGDIIKFENTEYRVLRTRSKHFVILWIDCIDVNV
jgi:hypothetical protein